MTEGISSSGNVSLNALSDLKSFFRSGSAISRDANKSEEEDKAAENSKRSNVTKKALSALLEKSYNNNLRSVRNNTEEEMQSNSDKTNPLQVDTSALSERTPLEIKRPEAKADSDPLKINVQASTTESQLQAKAQDTDTATKPLSSSIPKQKQAILYELKNTMHLKYSAWDIAKRYGISYLEAQEIFVDLNKDENGIVKEFNLPKNSTVSYLV